MGLPRLRWGIVGLGKIANRFADELHHSETGILAGVASRDFRNAQTFASKFGGDSAPVLAYRSYSELFESGEIDAIYIATVNTEHVRLVIQASRAGKHIICEKPLGVNHAEVTVAIEAARRAGVYLAEGFMYRFHPQTARLVELLHDGTIGDIQHVEASFSSRLNVPSNHRVLDPELAGGSILDVGGYPISAVRMVAGVAAGGLFTEPVALSANGTIGPSGVDEWANASLQFESGLTAHVSCGISLTVENRIVIYGSTGRILVREPWRPSFPSGSEIDVARIGEDVEIIKIPGVRQCAVQADALAANIPVSKEEHSGQSTLMSWADSLGNARTLDLWRAAIGLRYPFEVAAAEY